VSSSNTPASRSKKSSLSSRKRTVRK
jgi:hypothetical protein